MPLADFPPFRRHHHHRDPCTKNRSQRAITVRPSQRQTFYALMFSVLSFFFSPFFCISFFFYPSFRPPSLSFPRFVPRSLSSFPFFLFFSFIFAFPFLFFRRCSIVCSLGLFSSKHTQLFSLSLSLDPTHPEPRQPLAIALFYPIPERFYER